MKEQAARARKQRDHELEKLTAEGRLLDFTRWMFEKRNKQPFLVNIHHEAMDEALMAVINGQIANLIINIPPRYSKTEEAVIGLVPFCFARNPASNFIHLSYAEKLVLDNSSQIRETIEHEAYQDHWPLEFKEDTNAKGLWRNSQGGGFLAVAAGGTITGFGAGSTAAGCVARKFAGAVLIDDPLKPDDARSDVERAKVNNRLNGTIISRRNNPKETPIILIMQRLHEDDMTGYILQGNTPLNWHHLCIPAELPGKRALWPLKHTWDDLQRLKKADPYTYSGQYLQRPSPVEGSYFKREMFRLYGDGFDAQGLPYKKMPDTCNFYGASDYATKALAGDYTVHGVGAVDHDDNLYICDWWREQAESDVWVERAIDMMEAWEPLAWGEEMGQIRNVMGPILTKRMQERRVYCHRVPYPTTSDAKDKSAKMGKCRSIQARMAAGKVFFPANAPWLADLIEECMKFPNGQNDDQADVLGTLGRMLTGMVGQQLPPKKEKPQMPKNVDERSLDELWEEQEGDQGRRLV